MEVKKSPNFYHSSKGQKISKRKSQFFEKMKLEKKIHFLKFFVIIEDTKNCFRDFLTFNIPGMDYNIE